MFFEKKVRIIMVDFVGFEKTVKVMSYAKGLVSKSRNPIAKAVFELGPEVMAADVKIIKEFKDYGLAGEIENDKLLFGTESVMKENNIKLNGDTAHKVFFAINNQVQAVFRMDD